MWSCVSTSSTFPRSSQRGFTPGCSRGETKASDGVTQAGEPIGRPRLHGIGPLVPGAGGELAVTARELGAQAGEFATQAGSNAGQGVEAPGLALRAGAVLPEPRGPGDDEVWGSGNEIGVVHR